MRPPYKLIITSEMEQYRYDTWADKEPETIEWINSFRDGDCFFDVGANIGIYTLYAASRYPNSKIYAFEPDPKNYFRLLENVLLNGYTNIVPLPLAVGSEIGLVSFDPGQSDSYGRSGGQMHKSSDGADSIVCVTVDTMGTRISGVSPPAHIKVDIDGQEMKVIEGMMYTLGLPVCRSVLIELDKGLNDIPLIVEIFKLKGFTIENKFNYLDDHSRVRREKEGINCENVVFTK
jgi:FkbM family methyltransferase